MGEVPGRRSKVGGTVRAQLQWFIAILLENPPVTCLLDSRGTQHHSGLSTDADLAELFFGDF